MAEDGRVEYAVRADTSKLDSDLDSAKKKIVKSAEETAEKQEKSEKKTVDAVKSGEKEKIKAVDDANDKIEDSTGKSQKKNESTVSKIAKKIKSHIKEAAEDSAADVEKQSNNSEKSVENASSGIISAVGKAVAAVGGISAAFQGVVSTINSAVSVDKGTNQLAASLGITAEEAEKYAETIKSVYANNYGESIEDISGTISLIKQQMRNIGDDELQGVTEAAYMLADVYDMDVSESIRGANSIINQFGLSATEAYNLMAQGAEKGLNQNGDLADQIAEYATYYSQLGFSAEDAFNMMQTAAENGVYQIDKINDAVKEFGIRAIDGSETTSEAFKTLNLDADKLAKAFAEGGDTAAEAFDIVIDALADMDDAVAQDAVGVALFGTQWEDLGSAAVLSLADVNNEIDVTRDKLQEISEVKYDDLSSMLETLKRKFELLLQPLGEQLIPVIIEVVEELTPVVEALIPSLIQLVPKIADIVKSFLPVIVEVVKFIVEFKDVLGPLAVGLGTAKLAMKAFTAACNTNVFVLLASALASLVAVTVSYANTSFSCSEAVENLCEKTNQLRQSTEESIASGEAECAVIQAKADRYEELRQKVERTAAEEAELKNLALDLQSALGNNVTLIDALTGEYYSAADAVDAYCQQKMREIKLSVYEDQAKNSTEQYYEIQKQLEKKWKELDELESNVFNYSGWGYMAKKSQIYNDIDALKQARTEAIEANQEAYAEMKKIYAEDYGSSSNASSFKQISSNGIETNGEKVARLSANSVSANNSSGTSSQSNINPYAYTSSESSSTSSPSSGAAASSASATNSTKTASSTSTSANYSGTTAVTGGNTINITSYIPTVWDDVETANAKLKAGIGASLAGNSKSGKLITGMNTAAQAAITSTDATEATLNDVVKAIGELKDSQQDLTCTVTAILKCDSVTLAKQTVKGIKAIEKSTGKSPI